LFFDPAEELHPQHPVNLDYQQFISEGNLLLNQIAPELISEIDWPQDASNLTPEALLQLQHRVEYMEAHLTMRVKEYQLAFDKSSRQFIVWYRAAGSLRAHTRALGEAGRAGTNPSRSGIRRGALHCSSREINPTPSAHS
jgi:hypothetical protein